MELDPVLVARTAFGIEGRAAPLPSYLDTNFRIEGPRGERYVLRIAHAGEEAAALHFQHRVLERLEERDVPAPRVVRAPDGADVVPLELAGETRLVRLHGWLAGSPLAEEDAQPAALLGELGAFLARLDDALVDLEPFQPEEDLRWDLRRAGAARVHLAALPDGPRRERVARILDRFVAETAARLDALPRGVIHNDANDYNVLIDRDAVGTPFVSGLTDFGDAVHTAILGELAIAETYVMLAKEDPIPAASALAAGYHDVRPLSGEELALLGDLVETRLAVSVLFSAAERARSPDNAYVSVTEPHAWRLLDWFEGQRAHETRALSRALEDACR